MPDSADRSYTAGSFAVEIDGVLAGFASSVGGGNPFGIVAQAKTGNTHKHLANVDYRAITITCGAPAGAFGDWITGFFAGKRDDHDGAIIFLDYTFKQIKRLEWKRALIKTVTFPRLDATSKDRAALLVTIKPAFTRVIAASGTALPSVHAEKVVPWLVANFALTLPGVDCSRVSAIEALTVSAAPVADELGEFRQPTAVSGPMEVGDLLATLATSNAADFIGWTSDFLVDGKHAAKDEKQATIVYLAPDMHSPLMSLQLDGVGIVELADDVEVIGSHSVARLRASMYCNVAHLLLPKSPAPAPSNGSPSTTSSPDPTVQTLAGAVATRNADPSAVAQRLLNTALAADGTGTDARHTDGRTIGAEWARNTATLSELRSLAGGTDAAWTGLSLSDGHTLISTLQNAGIVPAEHYGPLELARDPFVEGLVDGASDVLTQVQPHLTDVEPLPPNTCSPPASTDGPAIS